MANAPWVGTAEKIMLVLVAICVLAMLAIVAMHAGIIPGCKATRVC